MSLRLTTILESQHMAINRICPVETNFREHLKNSQKEEK